MRGSVKNEIPLLIYRSCFSQITNAKTFDRDEKTSSLKFDPSSGHRNHTSPLRTESHYLVVDILTMLVNLHNDRLVMVENLKFFPKNLEYSVISVDGKSSLLKCYNIFLELKKPEEHYSVKNNCTNRSMSQLL